MGRFGLPPNRLEKSGRGEGWGIRGSHIFMTRTLPVSQEQASPHLSHFMFYFALFPLQLPSPYLLPRLNPFLVLLFSYSTFTYALFMLSSSFLPYLSLHSSIFFFLIASYIISLFPFSSSSCSFFPLPLLPGHFTVPLKVQKIEKFFDSDFGICIISLLVMSKY